MSSDAQEPPGRCPHGSGVLHSPQTDEDYGRLRADVARIVAQICPYWLAGSSEDLVQEVMKRVGEAQKRHEGTAEFSTFYLRKAAHSVLVDEIRLRRRRPEIAIDREMEDAGPVAALPDPERLSAGRQLGRAIHDCLKTLVRPRRLAVVLHLQGHSVPEVGRLMRCAPKRADNLVYRGLADLRGCLERRGIAP